MQGKRQFLLGRKGTEEVTLPTSPTTYETPFSATSYGTNVGVYIETDTLSGDMTWTLEQNDGSGWVPVTDPDDDTVAITKVKQATGLFADKQAWSLSEVPKGMKLRLSVDTSGLTGTITNITIFA